MMMGYISIPLTRSEGWTNGRIFYNTDAGFVAESYGTTPSRFGNPTGDSQTTFDVLAGAADECFRRPRRGF